MGIAHKVYDKILIEMKRVMFYIMLIIVQILLILLVVMTENNFSPLNLITIIAMSFSIICLSILVITGLKKMRQS